MATKRTSGFTLVELMIVVAIIAILASVAIPKLMSSRVSANENAAIATLRSIASAQGQLQSSCAIDTDADGGGEFGFFGELVGSAPLRIWDINTQAVALDGNGLVLDPTILPSSFGNTIANPGNEAVLERAGYYFKMYLPGPAAGNDIPGIGETGAPGIGGATAGNFPDSDNCEVLWCCYAWPVLTEATGNRCFFVNQECDLLQTLNNLGGSNVVTPYDGLNAIPAATAAYSDMVGDPNPNSLTSMGASLGITAQIISLGQAANDGNVWTIVGN